MKEVGAKRREHIVISEILYTYKVESSKLVKERED